VLLFWFVGNLVIAAAGERSLGRAFFIIEIPLAVGIFYGVIYEGLQLIKRRWLRISRKRED
jgi:hypothetical protein